MDFAEIHDITIRPGNVTRVTIEKEEVMGLKDFAISAAAHHLTALGMGDLELFTIEEDTTDFFLYYRNPQES